LSVTTANVQGTATYTVTAVSPSGCVSSTQDVIITVTPVPNATESLEGVVLSRGRIIPAVNLRTRFGFSRIAYDLRTRLLVVEANGRMVGLIVDAAREFTTLAGSEIKPPPEAIANLNGDYLEGIANINGRVILVLKLEELLKIADEAPANEATN